MIDSFQPSLKYDAIDSATGDIVCAGITVASTLRTVGLGLIGISGYLRQPLLLLKTRSIHTFGVRFDLDLAFFDSQGVCLRRIDGVKPWRVVCGPKGTVATLETKAARPSVLQAVPQDARICFEASKRV